MVLSVSVHPCIVFDRGVLSIAIHPPVSLLVEGTLVSDTPPCIVFAREYCQFRYTPLYRFRWRVLSFPIHPLYRFRQGVSIFMRKGEPEGEPRTSRRAKKQGTPVGQVAFSLRCISPAAMLTSILTQFVA